MLARSWTGGTGMSAESNRATVLKFYEYMSKADFTSMFELMADDATWTVAGHAETFPHAGVHTKAERNKGFDAFVQIFRKLDINVTSTTAEADRVCIEFRTRGETHKGMIYENEMLCLHRLKNGKIVNIYEFLDQQATFAFERRLKDSGALAGH
jgi:ketosteroid isomerase-like protein